MTACITVLHYPMIQFLILFNYPTQLMTHKKRMIHFYVIYELVPHFVEMRANDRLVHWLTQETCHTDVFLHFYCFGILYRN